MWLFEWLTEIKGLIHQQPHLFTFRWSEREKQWKMEKKSWLRVRYKLETSFFALVFKDSVKVGVIIQPY